MANIRSKGIKIAVWVADGFQQVELGSGEALDDARRRDTHSIAEEPQAVTAYSHAVDAADIQSAAAANENSAYSRSLREPFVRPSLWSCKKPTSLSPPGK
ncbi:MAG: hypothetical protein JWQ50_8349 [Caballeronia mineralivorans]|jgi:hypothetical protein|nr:hypothetical protein [Caballeronia mineralivorans]MEA3095975.1 hypothetical protein [Caballeronia mineralivorans]